MRPMNVREFEYIKTFCRDIEIFANFNFSLVEDYMKDLAAAQAQMIVKWNLGLQAKVGFVTCKYVTKHMIITCPSRATHVTSHDIT